MKKLFVGLLSVFMVFGGGLLSACGEVNREMKVYDALGNEIVNAVDLEIGSTDPDGGYVLLSADVLGINDEVITPSAAGYENFVNPTVERTANGQTLIKVVGLSETTGAPAVVELRATPGNIVKQVYINVYSQVSSMQVNEENKSKVFFVGGDTYALNNSGVFEGSYNKLVENDMIKFSYSQNSRRDLVWEIYKNASEFDILSKGQAFEINDYKQINANGENVVVLEATDCYGGKTDGANIKIEVPVLDEIPSAIKLAWTNNYSTPADTEFSTDPVEEVLISNFSKDEKYIGYAYIDYAGSDLEVTPIVEKKQIVGTEIKYIPLTEDQIESQLRIIEVEKQPGDKYTCFRIATADDDNVSDYRIYFKVGYAEYNYYGQTPGIMLDLRQMVKNVILSTKGYEEIIGNPDNGGQTNVVLDIYDNYAIVEGVSHNAYGQIFKVALDPVVADGSNEYSLTLEYKGADAITTDGSCPIKIMYMAKGSTTPVLLEKKAGTPNDTWIANNISSEGQLYVIASEKLENQKTEDLELTLISNDNPYAKTVVNLELYKSATSYALKKLDGQVAVDSSDSKFTTDVTFTLEGQTSIDGLSIKYEGESVSLSDLIFVSSGVNSVTFKTTVTLKEEALGKTLRETYQIVHENGSATEEFTIAIFLPFNEVTIYPDMGSDLSNSIVNSEYTGNDVSSLMLKNNTTTPLLFSMKETNGFLPQISSVSVKYYTYAGSTPEDLETFLSEADVKAKAKAESSTVVSFEKGENNIGGTIRTNGVGYAYMVLTIKGLGYTSGWIKDTTIDKIILIESFNSPEGMYFADANDRVELVALNSVSESDENITYKEIEVKFENIHTTYCDADDNIDITSKFYAGTSENYYTISNLKVTEGGLTFKITALSSGAYNSINDIIEIVYSIDKNGKTVSKLTIEISLTIKNAQRIESVAWVNSDKDGLYYEVGSSDKSQYVILETSPTNADNKGVSVVVTDENGNQTQQIVYRNTSILAENVIALNMAESINKGQTGYVYILPNDAVFNFEINYYYYQDADGQPIAFKDIQDFKQEPLKASTMLGQIASSYDFLINNAFFASNAGEEVRFVSLADIILRITIEVADGSEAHPLRVYNETQFNNIDPALHYIIMNDISATTWTSKTTLSGGIKGYSSDVTITLEENNIANIIAEGAYIKNLTFIGNVIGGGFVADENYGTIKNVTIDTNGNKASALTSLNIAGGIVGANKGIMNNVAVLGINIAAEQIAGGIAGVNNGIISDARVEFYNLATAGGYAVNTINATYVGALVGTMNGGKLENSYAYDYTLSSTNNSNRVLGGTTNDPFVADYDAGEINKVFAVVGLDSTSATVNGYYLGYFEGTEYKVNIDNIGSDNVITSGDEGFEEWVNGGNSYYKDMHQAKALTEAEIDDANVQTIKDANGYYKSVAVDETKGILFFYTVENESDLSTSEVDDLTALNTIKIKNLLGMADGEGVVASSSDPTTVKIKGSTIEVLKTGEITLRISAKQDASIDKDITLTITNAITEFILSDIGADGKETLVTNKVVNIQKTKEKDIIVTHAKTNLYLGNLANAHAFPANGYTLMVTNGGEDNAVQAMAGVGFVKLNTDENSVSTTISVYPYVFEDATLQQALKNATIIDAAGKTVKVFTKTFTANPTDGTITFMISAQEKPLTPSTTTVVKAKIVTTAEDEIIFPEIIMGDRKSPMKREESGNEYIFFNVYNQKLLSVIIDPVSENEEQSPYIYEYNLVFAVHEEYKSKVSDDIEFKVFFKTPSGAISDEFKLTLSRQEITNIDTASFKITETSFQMNGSMLTEQYKATQRTSVLAPGNSAILKVNVNPDYAYYDYAEIAYSGASVPNAVNIEAVEEKDLSNGLYKTLSINTAKIERIGERVRYTPAENATSKHKLYFKLWINTTVDRNTQLKFTVSFYKNGQKEALDFVNYYIDVKYLTQARVTIGGEEVAYVAKGTSSEVKIEVLEDQYLDSLVLSGTSIEGVYLSSLSERIPDPARGIAYYTALLQTDVNAQTQQKNRFYIQASVSRELNGALESKTTYATAVIVDFTIDEINVTGINENVLTVWQNVPKQFNLSYRLSPDDNDYIIDSETQDVVNDLKKAKKDFANNHFYPTSVAPDSSTQAEYYINYEKTEDGWKPIELIDRIFIKTASGTKQHKDASFYDGEGGDDLPFRFEEDEVTHLVKVKGIKSNSAPVTVVVYTYIEAGGMSQTIATEFTVVVETYSDPDLPLSIRDAEDFLKLDPTKMAEGTTIQPQDYILENDILLENYVPFDTSAIRSLDGNGYTIYIKSFDLETPQTLNLALFNTVKTLPITQQNKESETTLKNLRVNYYNGGQLVIDVSRHKEINIAGIAITNEGVITNCEVVSFYQDTLVGESIDSMVGACLTHNGIKGFNVAYRNGANTTENTFITKDSNWTSQIAGFVINNNGGSITNSRVGGNEIYLITSAEADNEYATSIKKSLDNFHIVGQGDIAGFVLNNNGAIASSFVKNIDITNHSNATKFVTAGFVKQNAENSTILTSYIEGVPSVDIAGAYAYANDGSNITSENGIIAGFIYNNKGSIKNSYSNIEIANSTDLREVYLASGFVYENEGRIENCYSASQVENANFSQMNFSGVNKDNELLAKTGKYINSYYYSADNYAAEVADSIEDTTESKYRTGALLIKDPSALSSFYGFAIAENPTDFHKDGIWIMDDVRGIKLVEADQISYSHRYKSTIEGTPDNDFYLTQEIDGKSIQYILPYGTIYVNSTDYINTTLGGDHNPILISSAEDWQDINGASTSSVIKDYYKNNKVTGVYRIAKDIDVSSLNKQVLSATNSFSGALYGNGFTFSGISLSQAQNETSRDITSFGLFASISTTLNESGKRKEPAILANFNLDVQQVTAGNVAAVGSLAGRVRNATIVNVAVNFQENAIVEGMHYVGGLVGFADNDNKIKNITISNPDIIADTYTEDDTEQHYIESTEIKEVRNNIINNVEAFLTAQDYSYAGAAIGFIDAYEHGNEEAKFNYAEPDDAAIYDINNIRVEGSINVKAQVVGGAFGFVGINTDVNDVGVTINTQAEKSSKLIASRYFAGGVIGQSFGRISRIYAEHDLATQNNIEDQMAEFYAGSTDAERGLLDLFDTTNIDMENTQIAVGGLIGIVGGGYIEVSYSKLNVTAMSADYAGGVIGYTDVSHNDSYTAELGTIYNDNGEPTKLFINEVYATGDVRSSVMAGGIIGAIENENSHIKMLAVNALNYFANYDYTTGEYVELTKGQYEISSNFKINSFVGKFIDSEGNHEEFDLRYVGNNPIAEVENGTGIKNWREEENNYQIRFKNKTDNEGTLINNYISFAQAVESLTAESGSAIGNEPLASVARYDSYRFGTQFVYMKRFGEPVLTIGSEENKTYFKEGEDLVNFNADLAKVDEDRPYMLQIYSVGSPWEYTDSSVGHTRTQAGFLNSGIWIPTNWDHLIDDLMPSIKKQISYNVVYLDVFNANSVFAQMANNPNLAVIVRGLKTPTSDLNLLTSYSDIHIYHAGDELGNDTGKFRVQGSDGESFGKIQRFAGKIIGGKYPLGNTDEDGFVKIVSHAGNYIESVNEGFAVISQSFAYGTEKMLSTNDTISDVSTIINIENGLFINKSITGAKLTDVKIILEANVKVSKHNLYNYGLLSPEIYSSIIQGLTVDALDDKNITESVPLGTSEPLLDISIASPKAVTEGVGETLNVGLISGSIKQESPESIMTIKDIEILTKGTENSPQSIISVGNRSFSYINVGGYFGCIDQDVGTTTYRVGIAGFSSPVAMAISSNAVLDSKNKSHHYIGGFAGNVKQIKYLTSASNCTLNYDIAFTLPEECNDLRLGNVIGCLSTGSSHFIKGSTSDTGAAICSGSIKQKIVNKTSTNFAYVGGVVGYHAGAPLTIEGFGLVESGMLKDNTTFAGELTTSSTLTGGMREEDVPASGMIGEIAYGGFVGISAAQLNIVDETNTNIKISGDVNLVGAEMSKPISAGSIVGKTTAVLAEIDNTEGTTLNILGNYTSNENFTIKGAEVMFGGIVGHISSGETEAKQSVALKGKREGLLMSYNGDVNYSSDAVYKRIRFGGIVGSISNSADTGNSAIESLEINYTSFGGSLSISDANNADVTFGGTIGYVNVDSNNKGKSITMQNGYNYGDMFVEYTDDFTQLSEYNYGGLIGKVGSASYTIKENYVAVSSHNSRYMTSTNNTAHALYGDGIPGTINNSVSADTNYYSHAVCLLTDDNGTDVAYNTNYENTATDKTGVVRKGYATFTTEYNIVNEIANGLGIVDPSGKILDKFANDFKPGHKLNPSVLTQEVVDGYAEGSTTDLGGLVEAENKFNDLAYFTLEEDIEVSNKTFNLINAVFIGDAFKVKFINNDATKKVYALFYLLSGHSYVSSLVEEVDVNLEINEDRISKGYSGLTAGTDCNTQIYAVNVYGHIDVGSQYRLTLAGLGTGISGRIADCSTDVDIIERGADVVDAATRNAYNWVCAFVSAGANQSGIENCFSLGSITTYSGGYLFPFSSSSTTISNCYSATHTDWRDYLNLQELENTYGTPLLQGTTSERFVLNLESYQKCYYDCDALQMLAPNGTVSDKHSTYIYNVNYTNLENTLKSALIDQIPDLWTTDNSFNYGYPTLKYGYLKMSSYATRDNVMTRDCGCVETINIDGTITVKTHCSGHAHDNGENIYDYYIENYTYTRCENGVDASENDNSFYMLTNARVFKNVFGEWDESPDWAYSKLPAIECKNYILKYDVDLTRTGVQNSFGGFFNVNTNSGIYFVGQIDGQGHTINGVKTSLFADTIGISKNASSVRNLRLTNIDTKVPALVLEDIVNSTISNITINGKISIGNDAKNSGSLAGSVSNSIVSNITSASNIQSNMGATIKNLWRAGGIIGGADNSTILYCANYGNISVNPDFPNPENTYKGYSIPLGGIVGSCSDNKIAYCFNAGSVLNGIDFSGVECNFISGGIVGKAENSEIDSCYNTGVIKSGNKKQNPGEYLGVSKERGINSAGGIVGRSEDSKSLSIENSYNVGTVEALGANSEWWVNVEGEYIEIFSISNKNVEVYSIGPGANRETNYAEIRQDDEYRTSVFANGAGLESETTLFKWKINSFQVPNYWSDSEYWKKENKGGYYTFKSVHENYEEYHGSEDADEIDISGLSPEYDASINLDFHYAFKGISGSVIDNASVNFLGIPTAITLPCEYELVLGLQARSSVKGLIAVSDLWRTSVLENIVYGLNVHPSEAKDFCGNVLEQYCMMTLGFESEKYNDLYNNFKNTDTPKVIGELNSLKSDDVTSNDCKYIIQRTKPLRSQYEILDIGDSKIYVPKNNVEEIFYSGMQEVTLEIDHSHLEIGDSIAYDVEIAEIKDDFGELVPWMLLSKSTTFFTAKVFCSKDYSGNFTASLSTEYSQEGAIDISNINFYILPNGNIGLGTKVSAADKEILEMMSVDQIYRVNNSSKTYKFLDDPNHPTAEIYLEYNEVLKDFVYIPSGTITIGGTNIPVNTLTLDEIANKTWTLQYHTTKIDDMLFTKAVNNCTFTTNNVVNNTPNKLTTISPYSPLGEEIGTHGIVDNISGTNIVFYNSSNEIVGYRGAYLFVTDISTLGEANRVITDLSSLPAVSNDIYWELYIDNEHTYTEVIDGETKEFHFTAGENVGKVLGNNNNVVQWYKKTGGYTAPFYPDETYTVKAVQYNKDGSSTVLKTLTGVRLNSYRYILGATKYTCDEDFSDTHQVTGSTNITGIGNINVTIDLCTGVLPEKTMYYEIGGDVYSYNITNIPDHLNYNIITDYTITKTPTDGINTIGAYSLDVDLKGGTQYVGFGLSNGTQIALANSEDCSGLHKSTYDAKYFELHLSLYQTHVFNSGADDQTPDGNRDYDIYFHDSDSYYGYHHRHDGTGQKTDETYISVVISKLLSSKGTTLNEGDLVVLNCQFKPGEYELVTITYEEAQDYSSFDGITKIISYAVSNLKLTNYDGVYGTNDFNFALTYSGKSIWALSVYSDASLGILEGTSEGFDRWEFRAPDGKTIESLYYLDQEYGNAKFELLNFDVNEIKECVDATNNEYVYITNDDYIIDTHAFGEENKKTGIEAYIDDSLELTIENQSAVTDQMFTINGGELSIDSYEINDDLKINVVDNYSAIFESNETQITIRARNESIESRGRIDLNNNSDGWTSPELAENIVYVFELTYKNGYTEQIKTNYLPSGLFKDRTITLSEEQSDGSMLEKTYELDSVEALKYVVNFHVNKSQSSTQQGDKIKAESMSDVANMTIALHQDIILGELSVPANIQSHIVGNGYTISTYGTPLLGEISENIKISNVSLLSQTFNSSGQKNATFEKLIFKQANSNSIVQNIDIFGSYLMHFNKILLFDLVGDIDPEAEVENISSHVVIDASLVKHDLSLNTSKKIKQGQSVKLFAAKGYDHYVINAEKAKFRYIKYNQRQSSEYYKDIYSDINNWRREGYKITDNQNEVKNSTGEDGAKRSSVYLLPWDFISNNNMEIENSVMYEYEYSEDFTSMANIEEYIIPRPRFEIYDVDTYYVYTSTHLLNSDVHFVKNSIEHDVNSPYYDWRNDDNNMSQYMVGGFSAFRFDDGIVESSWLIDYTVNQHDIAGNYINLTSGNAVVPFLIAQILNVTKKDGGSYTSTDCIRMGVLGQIVADIGDYGVVKLDDGMTMQDYINNK